MKYLKLVVLATALTASAYAHEKQRCNYDFDTSEYQKTYDGKAIIPHPRVAYVDSSEVLRHKKNFYAHASVGLIATQISASYFFNPDTLFDASFMYQKDTITGISMLYSLTATRFVSDSLYFRGGPGYRIGDTVNYLNSFGKTNPGLERSSDVGLELGVGNRWQFEKFSVGGEWFAIYIPLIADKAKTFDFQFRIMMMQVGVAF